MPTHILHTGEDQLQLQAIFQCKLTGDRSQAGLHSPVDEDAVGDGLFGLISAQHIAIEDCSHDRRQDVDCDASRGGSGAQAVLGTALQKQTRETAEFGN